jgi:hypothetical protein
MNDSFKIVRFHETNHVNMNILTTFTKDKLLLLSHQFSSKKNVRFSEY